MRDCLSGMAPRRIWRLSTFRAWLLTAQRVHAGTIVDGYPFRTSGKIVSPVTITRLFDGPAQHLLVSCFDGFFYVIDAITLCAGAPLRLMFRP